MGRGFGGAMGMGRGMGRGFGGGAGRSFGGGAGPGGGRGRWGLRFGPSGWRAWFRGTGLPEWVRERFESTAVSEPVAPEPSPSAPAPTEPDATPEPVASQRLAPTADERQAIAKRIAALRVELDRLERELESNDRTEEPTPSPPPSEQG